MREAVYRRESFLVGKIGSAVMRRVGARPGEVGQRHSLSWKLIYGTNHGPDSIQWPIRTKIAFKEPIREEMTLRSRLRVKASVVGRLNDTIFGESQ